MIEEQRKEIMNNLKQMKIGLNCIVGELNSDHIIGRKTRFEYLDFQINNLYECIGKIVKMAKKESES